ncbi:hypothetical protein SAMN05421811_103466 [Nonomuraea wenchangensis]|uniref:Uncharacterized protein n=1 Tax=Nonomuraea wenchangensis TaxID=568860 RepID=A0A1I0FH12_9ACTN|nr:hypothetical protein SAMN05421811_103466 [Nonomuraea wenchangensis]
MVAIEPTREPYDVPVGARVIARMPTPDERRDLATSGELREFGGMPEGVPVFEIVPGPRKHRRVLRGDRIELMVRGPENSE